MYSKQNYCNLCRIKINKLLIIYFYIIKILLLLLLIYNNIVDTNLVYTEYIMQQQY